MTLDETDRTPEDKTEHPPAPADPTPVVVPGAEPDTAIPVTGPDSIPPGTEPPPLITPEFYPGAQPVPQAPPRETHYFLAFLACLAGILLPGLGHAVLRKWDRALVFLGTITVMFFIGLQLHGRIFSPDHSDLFSLLKFTADAGIGLIYWVSWLRGLGPGDPTAYTYEFANVFIYVAGLLNMLVIVDAFDIAQGRKK